MININHKKAREKQLVQEVFYRKKYYAFRPPKVDLKSSFALKTNKQYVFDVAPNVQSFLARLVILQTGK